MKIKFLVYAIGIFFFFVGLFYLISTSWSVNQNHFNWAILTKGTSIHEPRYSHIFFFDKSNGIVLSGLTVKRTNDGGKSWNEVSIEGTQGFYSLVFTDNQHGWIVGSKSKKPFILETNDKGFNWQEKNFDEKSLSELNGKFTFFSDVCFNRVGKSWIVGDGGIVEIQIDDQSLKASSVFSTQEVLHSVSCDDSGEVWAVGENGVVLHYQNDWIKKGVDKKYRFERVISKGNDVWILGTDWTEDDKVNAGFPRPGILLRSRDNGQTWENKTPESAGSMNDLFLKDGKGWLVGAEGSIYYSSDNGNSWTRSKSPTKADLLNIFFLDSKTGWISGDRATILRWQN